MVPVQRFLESANRGLPRIEFLTELSKTVLELSNCEALDLRLKDPELAYRWEFSCPPNPFSRFMLIDRELNKRSTAPAGEPQSDRVEKLWAELISGRHVSSRAAIDSIVRRSIRTGRQGTRRVKHRRSCAGKAASTSVYERPFASFALIPVTVDDRTAGLLQLKSLRKNFFTKANVALCEGIARSVGIAIANRQAQWALRERVKELTCLYELGRIAQLRGITLKGILDRIVVLLPPAWQFPEIACARITLDGECYSTLNFRKGCHCQSADLLVKGGLRGSIEVVYTEDRPEFAEGSFLPEERSLLETIAREVALIVERRQSEEAQLKLQAQLRHADRLATIGQLAAGVAHELNEPLGNILGFAQLIRKTTGLQKETAADIDKIIKASLHAREVTHSLLVFSRQKAPVKAKVSLNRVVQEGLYFLESRCARAGIRVCSKLASDVPDLEADASQLHQVLVNLVVNGIQAMPEGIAR